MRDAQIVLSKEEYANVTVQMLLGKFAQVKDVHYSMKGEDSVGGMGQTILLMKRKIEPAQ